MTYQVREPCEGLGQGEAARRQHLTSAEAVDGDGQTV